MPVPPPTGDIEARLNVLAELLSKAVREVDRAMDSIKSEGPDPNVPPAPNPPGGPRES